MITSLPTIKKHLYRHHPGLLNTTLRMDETPNEGAEPHDDMLMDVHNGQDGHSFPHS